MKEEIWLDIPGYEGHYKASSLGQILSCERKCASRFGERTVKARILKPTIGKDYCNIGLNKDGIQEVKAVGYWVLLAFNKSEIGLCKHIDGDCKNNRLENLTWATQAAIEVNKLLRGSAPFGEDHRQAKLSNQAVLEIRSSNMTSAELARHYGVNPKTIRDIRFGGERKFG
jgi:hypothetical protein